MGYHCSVDGVAHYSGLVQICGDLWGEVGEVYKVSCTYRCSDHCHGQQHAEVLGVDVSSDILSTSSFVRHATAPWHWLGRREREYPQKHCRACLSWMPHTHTRASIGNKVLCTCACLNPHKHVMPSEDQRITKSVTSYIHSYFEENKKQVLDDIVPPSFHESTHLLVPADNSEAICSA